MSRVRWVWLVLFFVVLLRTAWIGDPFNRFGAAFGFGLEWGLDLLPKHARVLIYPYGGTTYPKIPPLA